MTIAHHLLAIFEILYNETEQNTKQNHQETHVDRHNIESAADPNSETHRNHRIADSTSEIEDSADADENIVHLTLDERFDSLLASIKFAFNNKAQYVLFF